MALEEYRRKRDRRRTPEPIPAEDPATDATGQQRFVIQDHHAGQLHWDVRLAGKTEDHPLPRELAPMQPSSGPLPHGDDWWLQLGFGGRRVIVRIDGGRARITDADCSGPPLTGATKADVLAHYLAVAEVMVAHLRDRPEAKARRRGKVFVFTLGDLPRRLAEHKDLLEPLLFTERQRLPRLPARA
ncbi:hypothetical protein [Pseudonocardia asaccharolytica]|uniref:Uncharacterized protein n=1 Tax=Pseudonocardia asaccharolytica DSM 44247 = NBRC 16224 TaxID=1123024 RepID=A0A511D6J0_9PSEU|nr:hypothetical protein [Pseudonocardia asaccharolytica]GEL20409.1 hypothetical protein PA7_42460 [Pseudonocardia asaccharolytica DSM 44247 = NBRC 16224]